MTANTAYQLWGVAQPQPPREGTVKWMRDHCNRAEIMAVEILRAKIAVLRLHLEEFPDYCAYWISYYETALQRREEIA